MSAYSNLRIYYVLGDGTIDGYRSYICDRDYIWDSLYSDVRMYDITSGSAVLVWRTPTSSSSTGNVISRNVVQNP